MRTTAIALLSLAACIDEYQGSNVQIDLSESMPVQAPAGATPRTGELPSNIHFTLYAFKSGADPQNPSTISDYAFEIQRFEIHRVVDLTSPCFIDVGDHVPFPGLHVSQYVNEMKKKTGIDDIANPGSASVENQIDMATAIQRYNNVLALNGDNGLKAVTSVSTGGYGAVAANCTDTNGIPPPTCTDADANRRRLAACQAAWSADPGLFEGTDRVLTKALNGTINGYVDIAMSPINSAPVGGAQFFVDETLVNFDGYALYWQYDDANNDGMPDYPSSVPAADRTPFGQLLIYGFPEQPTRGVYHVHMRGAGANAGLAAEMAIFGDLAQDDVHF